MMGQKHLLEYGGYTPAQAVLGHNPRGLYETETTNIMAHTGAAETSPDYFESYQRMRLMSRVSIQQAIIEHRVAMANRSHPMKIDITKLIPMKTRQRS